MRKIKIIGALLIALLLLLGACAPAAVDEEEGVAAPEEKAPPESRLTGKIAFVSSGNIHIINPDGTGETRLTEGDGPLWSPDGKKLAYLLVSGEVTDGLYVINADGTGKTKVVEDLYDEPKMLNTDIVGYSWSPDGRRIVFARSELQWLEGKLGEPGIYVVNADGSNTVRLLEGEASCPTFSTDGKKIAYAYLVREYIYYNLYVMNSDGTGKTKLIQNEIGVPSGCKWLSLSWSADGTKIAYCDYSDDSYIIDSDGSNKVLLGWGTCLPTCSPDGKKIAYVKAVGNNDYVFITNPDGTGKTEVVKGKGTPYAYISSLSWSPAGRRIVFSSGVDEAICIVNADGTGLVDLAYGRDAQWSPR